MKEMHNNIHYILASALGAPDASLDASAQEFDVPSSSAVPVVFLSTVLRVVEAYSARCSAL